MILSNLNAYTSVINSSSSSLKTISSSLNSPTNASKSSTITNCNINAATLKISQSLNQIRIIKILVAILLLASLLMNVQFFLFFNVISNKHNNSLIIFYNSSDLSDFSCSLESDYRDNFLIIIWHSLDTLFNFILPFLTMSIGFLFTYFILRKSNNNYVLNLKNDQSSQTMKMIYSKRIARNKRVLLKLLLINFYFACSIVPYLLSVYFVSYEDYDFLNNLALTFLYSNSAFTFFFFGITSQEFRSMFEKIKLKKC